MTEEERQASKDHIDAKIHYELARLRRFAPVGHPVFDMTTGLREYFEARLMLLGGMTPAISKALGWNQ